MVYGIQKGGRWGVVYCAIVLHEYRVKPRLLDCVSVNASESRHANKHGNESVFHRAVDPDSLNTRFSGAFLASPIDFD